MRLLISFINIHLFLALRKLYLSMQRFHWDWGHEILHNLEGLSPQQLQRLTKFVKLCMFLQLALTDLVAVSLCWFSEPTNLDVIAPLVIRWSSSSRRLSQRAGGIKETRLEVGCFLAMLLMRGSMLSGPRLGLLRLHLVKKSESVAIFPVVVSF